MEQIYKLDYQFEFNELFFDLLVTFNALICWHPRVRHFRFLQESLLNPFRWSVPLSVCMWACHKSRTVRRIFIKFYTGEFFQELTALQRLFTLDSFNDQFTPTSTCVFCVYSKRDYFNTDMMQNKIFQKKIVERNGKRILCQKKCFCTSYYFCVNRTKEALRLSFRLQGILKNWQNPSNIHKYWILFSYA
jgi:hypothetical protein